VTDEVGLTISVGVARTKLVAKIASDLRKPDGLVVVPPGTEAAFLAPLPIARLWASARNLRRCSASTAFGRIGDLAALPQDLLERRFRQGRAMIGARARGLDGDTVSDRDPAKSIGHEHTFDVDSSDREVIERSLLGLSEGVAGRLRDSGVKASTVTVKIRDSSFQTITRQRTLKEPTDLTEPIFRTALELARPEVAARRSGCSGSPRRAWAKRTSCRCSGRRSAPAPGRRGRGSRPASLRRSGDHAGAARPVAPAGAVRARPDDAVDCGPRRDDRHRPPLPIEPARSRTSSPRRLGPDRTNGRSAPHQGVASSFEAHRGSGRGSSPDRTGDARGRGCVHRPDGHRR
jgi:hypothetical protein